MFSIDQWSFGFTLELPFKFTLDAAYVRAVSHKLPINGRSVNEVSRFERLKAIERLGGNASYLTNLVTNPFVGLVPGTAHNNATIQRQNLLRPFPQFTGITEDRNNSGSGRYDAFEMVASRRFTGGLAAVFNYTLSKNFESTEYLKNGFDAKPWRSLASIDRTHRFVVTVVNLPFKEGVNFQFRAEAFNAFNTPIYGGPDTGVTSTR